MFLPVGDDTGRSYHQTRGNVREAFHLTERADVVLVGISIEPLHAASRRFGVMLLCAGAAVLFVGLGGGWILIGRSLRPVHDINAAAQRIAAGDLSERIPVSDTKNELGGLANVLNSTFARLDAAFSKERHFTADASHELRTPLTVILTETTDPTSSSAFTGPTRRGRASREAPDSGFRSASRSWTSTAAAST